MECRLDKPESLGRIETMEAKPIKDLCDDIIAMLEHEAHYLSHRDVIRADAVLEMIQANLLSLQLHLEDRIYKMSQIDEVTLSIRNGVY